MLLYCTCGIPWLLPGHPRACLLVACWDASTLPSLRCAAGTPRSGSASTELWPPAGVCTWPEVNRPCCPGVATPG